MTLANFTLAEIVQLAILILAVIGLFLKLSKDKTGIEVELNEHKIRILTIEKDMLAMKIEYTNKVNDTKVEFSRMVTEFKTENREDHSKVFDKLTSIGEAVTKVVASFESHVMTERASFVSPRDLKNN